MTGRLLSAASGLLLIGAAAMGQVQVATADASGRGGVASLEILPESRLWVEGGSTVRGYTCRAAEVDGEFSLKRPIEAATPEALAQAAAGVSVAVEVARMDCGNGRMDEHMRKALKAEEHGTIRFRSTSHTLVASADGARLRVDGVLSIAGREQAVTLEADAVQEGGLLRIRGVQPLRMTDYGIKPPSLMLGTLKVHDDVKVGYDLVVSP